MKPVNDPLAASRTQRLIRLFDYGGFVILMLFLVALILSSGMANIQTDAIDYYAIVQRLTPNSGNPIVQNLHFVDQRSPGYPILSLLPYEVLSLVVEPFVQTEKITSSSSGAQSPPSGAQPPSSGVQPPPSGGQPPSGQTPSESVLLPEKPILFKDVFFRNFYIPMQDSWFEWKIIGAMLLTGYGMLFIGLAAMVRMLALDKQAFLGASLAPLIAVTSGIFMHNIVMTPAYATLTAFGISALLAYFFTRAFLQKKFAPEFLSGVFAGLLTLTRLETGLIAGVIFLSLLVMREFRFLRNYVLGALVAVVILVLYNLSQFGTPLYLGILKGDINLVMLDWSYMGNSLFNPQSGILFWSPLVALGIIGLFLDQQRYSRILGISSLVLIALVLVRVPIMYTCIGQGTKDIGGTPIACPSDMNDMLMLIRSDANRYITVLIPFSVIGLRALVISAPGLFRRLRFR